MINITLTPKTREQAEYFRHEESFNGDISKTYTCNVIGSNLPTPKIIGFKTNVVNSMPQNYIVLEFEGRCNQTQMTLQFLNISEVIEENKVAFFTWLSGYFTWLNFIFKIFSVKTLKVITKILAMAILFPVALGLIYGSAEYTYEEITGDNFEDSEFVVWWSNFTIPKIGKYFKEDAMDDAGDFKDFVKDKAGDVIESTKDKAEDLKDYASDKIDDIKD